MNTTAAATIFDAQIENARRIARSHLDADLAALAPGEALETTEPVAWLTGAVDLIEEIDAIGGDQEAGVSRSDILHEYREGVNWRRA